MNIGLLIKRILIVLIGILLSALFLLYIANINLTDFPKEKDDIVLNSSDNILLPVAEGSSEIDGKPADGEWMLAYYDNFEGTELNVKKWSAIDRKDNFNNELQYYSAQNATVTDSHLYLTAKMENKEGKSYTSALVNTYGKISFCYGKIEFRLKLPKGKGLFPAIWLLQEEEGADYHEIDILEMVGQEPNLIYGVCHYSQNGVSNTSYGITTISNPEEFHTYGFEWSKNEMIWYIDDQPYFKTEQGIPHEKMYIIMNLAVGGDWPENPNELTPFPSSMVIDYIKIYQRF